jgi:hypothetical protein
MKFRSQYEPSLVMQGREFNRQGDRGLANFMTARTGMETSLADSHTGQDSNLLMNLINAAVGGKGMMTGAVGNMVTGFGNAMSMGGLFGGGTGGNNSYQPYQNYGVSGGGYYR